MLVWAIILITDEILRGISLVLVLAEVALANGFRRNDR
jgi:hypothetical protein